MEAEAPLVKRIAAILFREPQPLAACLLRLEAAFGTMWRPRHCVSMRCPCGLLWTIAAVLPAGE